jgi:hypothetical protein
VNDGHRLGQIICNLANLPTFAPPASRSSEAEKGKCLFLIQFFLCHWPLCRDCLQLASHKLRTDEAVGRIRLHQLPILLCSQKGKVGRFTRIQSRWLHYTV